MHNLPLISVLMTSYNREKYIAEAIESVLASSYKNFELIIVDDRSKDNTFAIAKEYEQKDQRIKVYLNDKNLGDYPNRNKAASYAIGKYLKYVDSDDIIYPFGLETMVRCMEMFPEAGMGFSHYRYNGSRKLPYIVSGSDSYKEHYFEGGFLYNGPTGVIYKRDYFEQLGRFDCQYSVATDYAFNLKAAIYKPVVVFQRDLFWWRPHDQQEINIKQDLYISLNYQINNYFLSLPECPLSLSERNIAKNDLHNIHTRRVYANLLRLNFEAAYSILFKSKISMWDLFLSLLPSSYRRKLQKIV